VEPESVIHVAARVAKDNGLADKVKCFQSKIEELELSQKVDVIISVFTGNFLLEEDLLPSLFLARDKHLASNGRLIPDQAKMFIQPITASKLHDEILGKWSELAQGFDFSLLRAYAANSIYTEEFRDIDYTPLAAPEEILHIDFMTATDADCKTQSLIECTEDGLCHGFFGWFDMRLGNHWLSTSPTAEKTHWRQVFLPLETALPVKKGQQMTFSLQRPEYGEWSWAVETMGSRQNHSTFLSRPVQPSDLAKKADKYKPRLNAKGQLASLALGLFKGNETAESIARVIISSEDTLFRSEAEARRFVAGLIDRYS
jgi:hypothetical protein